MFLLRAILNICVRNASPRGPMCFKCLIFNLSGSCELLPHTDINIAKANIQPYLQDVLKWTKDNNLLLNTDKMTCTLLTPDPAEYNTQLGLQIDNTTLPMTTHPKILGLTLDHKLTYNRHIDLAATKSHKTINILTSTKWSKHKETILATYISTSPETE